MSELQIKHEFLPVRCDICHQDDCFDPRRNHCSRCEGVTALAQSFDEKQQGLLNRKSFFEQNIIVNSIYRGLKTGALAGVIFSLVFAVGLFTYLLFLTNYRIQPEAVLMALFFTLALVFVSVHVFGVLGLFFGLSIGFIRWLMRYSSTRRTVNEQ